MKRLFAVFILMWSSSWAQKTDTVHVRLDSVDLDIPLVSLVSDASRVQQLKLNSSKNIGAMNLAEVIADRGVAFVKSYGLSSLSTLSLRGGGAAQTTVLWDGININTPTNGIVDFSLIPSALFDEAKVVFGGEAAKWGSGAQGAAIHLKQDLMRNEGFVSEMGTSVASYGSNLFNLKFRATRGKWSAVLYGFTGSANNDFNYEDPITGEEKFRKNAENEQRGLNGKLQYRFNSNTKIRASLWLQDYHRKIPSVLGTVERDAHQDDEFVRGSLVFETRLKRWKFNNTLALMIQDIHFVDPYIELDALNSSTSMINQLNTFYKVSDQLLIHSGVRVDRIEASSQNFSEDLLLYRGAVFANCKYFLSSKFKTILSSRLDYSENRLGELVYSAEINYALNKHFSINAKSGKVYRLPSLNDLYWEPGGNPALNPEYGSSHELGLNTEFELLPGLIFSNQTGGFVKWITDWIAWSPNGVNWSAQNLSSVWSRGIETDSDLRINIKDLSVELGVVTNYVLSTRGDSSSGEYKEFQLIYSPIYFGAADASIFWKQYFVGYKHTYTGYVYTSSDNMQYLSPFDVGSVSVGLKFKMDQSDVVINYRNNNIWNEQYQRIIGQPMPLMNHVLSLKVQMH